MTVRWSVRGLAGILVLLALTACAGGAPPAQPGAAEDFAAGGATAAPAPLTGPAQKAPSPQAPQVPPIVSRDIVKTATMTVTVADSGDPVTAADKAAGIAGDAGGRVDSRTEYGGSASDPARVALMLRVPADKLDGVIEGLKGLGSVDALDVRAEDVTSRRVDLDARIKALQTSVDRLLAIMRDARDPSALIEAENALSQRQADLDSLRAQRAALGDQIALSTVTVDLVAPVAGGPAPRQYQGFFGQVERGWDALVDTGTHMFLLVGLMVPWVGAALVLLVVVYAVIRLARLRR
ncbi:DUF4349 domain-containing protein [Mycolicibacterium neoaurum]|nr:DUF4349 domain-containing protein [Mycolicibacterium neoaurum]MDO3402416.1 DUF4349 domain-containing protein [Mycolicibacterium neoaurum]